MRTSLSRWDTLFWKEVLKWRLAVCCSSLSKKIKYIKCPHARVSCPTTTTPQKIIVKYLYVSVPWISPKSSSNSFQSKIPEASSPLGLNALSSSPPSQIRSPTRVISVLHYWPSRLCPQELQVFWMKSLPWYPHASKIIWNLLLSSFSCTASAKQRSWPTNDLR